MTRAVVVGAGFAGIGMVATLLRSGYTDVTVLEKGDDVGGVWRDNTYPGAACDVASHLYSFSFAPEGRWSRRFAEQREILAYLRRVADELGVTPLVRFGCEVAGAEWDDAQRTWTVALATGESVVADVLVTGVGQLSRPAYPDVPGLEDFAGACFHSARWDHEHDLTGERVVVLGTGASAIQLVPEVAKVAGHLTVLQRTASYVLPKRDPVYSPRTRRLLAQHPALLKADRIRTFISHDLRTLGFNVSPKLLGLLAKRFEKLLERQVPDPALRARLLPPDHMGCRRILLSNDWYPALQRDNVELVTAAVTRVLPQGVETADGRVVEVRPEAQARENAWLQEKLKGTVFATGCRSWYLTPDGRNTQNWPGSTLRFRLRTRRLRREDLEVRR